MAGKVPSKFVLRNNANVENCISVIKKYWQKQHEANRTIMVTIQRCTRSLEQNRRYWAILARISEQLRPFNKAYSSEVWHEMFKRDFLGIEPLPNGQYMSKSSAKLSIDEFANYMMQVEVWAVSNGVNLDNLDD